MAEEISARELWEPQRGAAILTLLHTLLHSNGQMMSWVQEYTSLKSREVYPPMGDGEGRQSICRTIRVPLQRYVWDHICVYSHFRRQEEIGWTQSNHCLPKQWTCGQKMGFCLILLLALAFCGERLHVRRAVLEFSPPLLPLVLAAFVLLPVTWQTSLTPPLQLSALRWQFQVFVNWWWATSPQAARCKCQHSFRGSSRIQQSLVVLPRIIKCLSLWASDLSFLNEIWQSDH